VYESKVKVSVIFHVDGSEVRDRTVKAALVVCHREANMRIHQALVRFLDHENLGEKRCYRLHCGPCGGFSERELHHETL